MLLIMNKFFIIALAIVVIAGGYIALQAKKPTTDMGYSDQYTQTPESTQTVPTDTQVDNSGAQDTPAVVTAKTPEQTTSASTAKTFTLAQVAQHADSTSCYSAVNGMVYDLTKWIARHPGGQREILAICGRDGSSAFNGQHGGDARPEQLLAGFEIGTLVK